jgi:hypothetical protein
MRVARYLVQLVLGIALTLAVQKADKRYRLTADQRERSWNLATWGSALYAVGPLSMIPWCFVTRRRLRGGGVLPEVGWGLLWLVVGAAEAVVLLLLIGLADEGFRRLADLPP